MKKFKEPVPPGPRDDGSDGYGYDPGRSAIRSLLEKIDPDVGPNPQPQQIGAALKIPKLTPVEKRLIEGRFSIIDKPATELVYQHTVLCQTSLPYRRLPPEIREHTRYQGGSHLIIQAGFLLDPKQDKFVPVPLPYGEKARLVLMYLNAQALRTKSPRIEVADSMTAFVRDLLGRDPNAREMAAVREQMNALAGSNIRLAMVSKGRAAQINTNIITGLDLWYPADPGQRVLWSSELKLSTEYFESLQTHAVPLDMRAISSLAHSSMALDVYTWLAQRLWRVPRQGQFVSWAALHEQFGQGYTRVRDFRSFFIDVLKKVKSVYPNARFDLVGDNGNEGLRLEQSLPPVAKRMVRISGKLIEHEP
jgi:hypothetical protein